ncbi:52 kDa repressor of the inhibitor of the protein kinase-like [Macrosteles quadrilineatus]|uniref:52 kDa repressor of the inhibitor of the protein kinase-like n=1 Tax=Macrosteles quadrilineatus TaxID=74068 RepID=UPI0023E0BCFB|nr:52 kDa repressor of the inhibitor of the protein kinase-like [Macrosteles quadrilineatus]
MEVRGEFGTEFLDAFQNDRKRLNPNPTSSYFKKVDKKDYVTQDASKKLGDTLTLSLDQGISDAGTSQNDNIPLRGHRDDGCLEETAGPSNEGYFRALLRFKVASGDEHLKRHLSTASSRATYISNTTQNDLITCCGEEITDTILSQVKNAKYYSVIFDETTDISHTEQLSLNLRYLYKNEIREDFVKFIDAYERIPSISLDQDTDSEQRLTGEALGKIVVKLLQELSLDLNDCVGIGTDSCSVMSSKSVGAVTEMQKVLKNACRCPCLNHVLNNSISTSVNVACIRNAVGVMKTVEAFFNMSSKRNQVLKATIGYQLSSLCETRWVERHESVIKFRAALTNIVDALTLITTWKDSKSSSTASTLLNSLCTPEFLISMLVLIDILKITLPLSRLLQTPSLDSNMASQAVTNTLTTIQVKRTQVETNFSKVFVEFTELAKVVDVEVRLPRLASKQTKRSNHPGTPEEYYRRSIYIPLLDNVSNDLSTRLSQSSLECFGLRGIIPTILVGAKEEQRINLLSQLKTAFDKFSSIIGSGDSKMNTIYFEDVGQMLILIAAINHESYMLWEPSRSPDRQMPPTRIV